MVMKFWTIRKLEKKMLFLNNLFYFIFQIFYGYLNKKEKLQFFYFLLNFILIKDNFKLMNKMIVSLLPYLWHIFYDSH